MAGAASLVCCAPAFADDFHVTQRDTFGEAGLLEMPNARMAPDGELSLTLSGIAQDRRASLGFQILPWLEGSFRYSQLKHWISQKQNFDRSFGLKMRLFEETAYTPDISIGVRDLIGTGVYGGEYLVASKQLWDVELTAGLGWGRLAANGTFRNPLGLISQTFDKRTRATGQGGTVDFGQLFHGPDTGIFGGAVWHTPIDNLNLTLEYSSERYLVEHEFGGLTVKSPINVGVTYAPTSNISLTAGWFYGNTFSATASFSVDPGTPAAPAKLGAAPVPIAYRSDTQQTRAVADLVNSMRPGDVPLDSQYGPGPQASAKTRIDAPQHMEVDGRVLLIDVRAAGHAHDYCRNYALQTAASNAQIDSIAVTDLDDPRSVVALCDVPGAGAKGQMIAASMQTDDQPPIEGPDIAQNGILAGAPLFDADAATQKIRDDAAAQSLRVEAIYLTENQATVYYSNTRYDFEAEALGRMVRVLMADTPPSIEMFRLVPVYEGQPSQDVQIFRAPMERMFEGRGATVEVKSALGIRPAPLHNPILDAANDSSYPRFYWSISPSMRQGLFDPSAPLRLQVFAAVGAGVTLLPGVSLEAQFEGNIYNTFAHARVSDSVLPHVRSDFARYLSVGKNGISSLDLVYRGRIAPDVFIEGKAGYVEDMFAGVGGQILWRPEGGRWALGGDLYEVWQRNFDRLFGFQHYHVLTGHASIYYQSPWHNIDVNLHVGRYLAGDDGLTMEISRRFDTGVEVGAFATFTNVPFAKFGEGSFDKGITIHIPLEWALPFSSQSSYNLALRPLTRDGGQRLSDDDSLYEETRRTSFDEITEHANDIAYP